MTRSEAAVLLDVHEHVAALVDGFSETVELDDGSRRTGRLPGLVDLLDREARGAASGGSGGPGGPDARLPIFTPAYDALLGLAAATTRLCSLLEVAVRPDLKDTLRLIRGSVGGRSAPVQDEVELVLAEHVAHARHVLSIDLPPISLRGVRCPYCSQASILASRRESRAWCSTAGCADPEGRRYVWVGELALRRLGATQQGAGQTGAGVG